MPRVVHFEISADDPERAAAFYRSLFGWKIERWEGPVDYWMVSTGPVDQPGIDGGLFVRKGPVGHVNTVDVPDIEAYTRKVTGAGGEVVVARQPIPGVGWNAYCKDTEGSIFGLFQADPSAK